MTKENQVKLDALMLIFAELGEEHNRISFDKEWQPFYQNLTSSEKKIAIKAWFDTILATAKAVRKDVEYIVKNGTDEEVEDYRNFFKNLHKHPFFDKHRVAA
jgi:ribosomal protein L17